MLASSSMDNSLRKADLHDLWTGCASPVLAPHQLAAFVEEVWMPNLQPYNFLLVDDNEINLRIFSRVLRKIFPRSSVRTLQESTRVDTTESALLHFDVIFLDIEMPEVTGTEIASRVRCLPELGHVGLVAVTTRYSGADLELYQRCGFDYAFPKPVENFRLIQHKVEQVLRNRARI